MVVYLAPLSRILRYPRYTTVVVSIPICQYLSDTPPSPASVPAADRRIADVTGKCYLCRRKIKPVKMKKLIIFDLDGTLLNTIADLAQSTNHALNALGYPTHDEASYKFMVGNGINKLFERALPEGEKTEENVLRVRAQFIPYYDCHNADRSRPYPGITELLEQLQSQHTLLAVASNKYHAATTKLIAHYFPQIRFAAVYGQREGIATKPDPTIVADILHDTGVQPEDVLYVGDSAVDMQTALNAGVTACGVTWGFRPRTELEALNPAYIVDQASDILKIANK